MKHQQTLVLLVCSFWQNRSQPINVIFMSFMKITKEEKSWSIGINSESLLAFNNKVAKIAELPK